MVHIGLVIKQLRKEKGLELTEFAEACGVAHSIISKCEAGKSTPSGTNLRKIAKFFGLELYDLREMAEQKKSDTQVSDEIFTKESISFLFEELARLESGGLEDRFSVCLDALNGRFRQRMQLLGQPSNG